MHSSLKPAHAWRHTLPIEKQAQYCGAIALAEAVVKERPFSDTKTGNTHNTTEGKKP